MAFAQTSPVTVTGFLTDTSCGKRGATSLHIDCPKRKVAAGTAKYAIYDQASRRLYVLACAAPVSSDAAAWPGGSDDWKNLDQSCVEQYLGQRVRISGTVTASRLSRAGQVLAPDDSSSASSASSTSTASTSPLKVVPLPRSLDSSTPIAGVLTISTVASPPVVRRP
jgi:hypothetical protein